MIVHIAGLSPGGKFPATHLYTSVKRGTVWVKWLARKHNAVTWSGLEPGPPDPQSSALTIRPTHLPKSFFFFLHKPLMSKLIEGTLMNVCLPGPSRENSFAFWRKSRWMRKAVKQNGNTLNDIDIFMHKIVSVIIQKTPPPSNFLTSVNNSLSITDEFL